MPGLVVLINPCGFQLAPYGLLDPSLKRDKTVGVNQDYFSVMVKGHHVEVRDTAFGRAVFATRDLSRGEIAFEEEALATVTFDKSRCSFCANAIFKVVNCPKCICERYCSESCRLSALGRYHEVLCARSKQVEELFDSMGDTSDLTETCQTFFAIKIMAWALQRSQTTGLPRHKCCEELDLLCSWADHDPR